MHLQRRQMAHAQKGTLAISTMSALRLETTVAQARGGDRRPAATD